VLLEAPIFGGWFELNVTSFPRDKKFRCGKDNHGNRNSNGNEIRGFSVYMF
jgi:hypothetical protein